MDMLTSSPPVKRDADSSRTHHPPSLAFLAVAKCHQAKFMATNRQSQIKGGEGGF